MGARALGIEIGIAGAPEVGLKELPDGDSRLGVDVELRLGVDFVELARFCKHVSASHAPLPP